MRGPTRGAAARRRAVGVAVACAALAGLGPAGAHAAGTSLSVAASAATLGPFVPGVARTYTTSVTASVSASDPGAILTIADPSPTATGRLANGAVALAHPIEASATSAVAAGGTFAAVGGTPAPLTLLTYAGPVSDDPATISLRQSIDATEPLRTGTYGKTLVLTLSTGTP